MLKKTHFYILIFTLRERVVFCPAFLVEVGNNMLACDRTGIGAEYPYGFVDPCLMMTDSAVAHSITFTACELIEPVVKLSVGLSKEPDGFCAMSLKIRHK